MLDKRRRAMILTILGTAALPGAARAEDANPAAPTTALAPSTNKPAAKAEAAPTPVLLPIIV